jgi:hypothetical protein
MARNLHVIGEDNTEVGSFSIGDHEDVSDGYHTFRELHDHRRALTAVLAACVAADSAAAGVPSAAWRSKNHHPDDSPMFDGYFIIGIELDSGTITYHYKLTHWDDFAAVPEIPHAPKWDGATPADTVTRPLEVIKYWQPDARPWRVQEDVLHVSPSGHIAGVDYGPCFGGCTPYQPCRQLNGPHWFTKPKNAVYAAKVGV